jgi:hypothetical protein
MKVLMEIAIWMEGTCEIASLKREINEKAIGANYKLENFLGKSDVFVHIEKDEYDEKKDVINVSGNLSGRYGYVSKIKYGSSLGLNITALGVTPEEFLASIDNIKELGFTVEIDHEYMSRCMKRIEHNKNRTKFQIFFGLNKYAM